MKHPVAQRTRPADAPRELAGARAAWDRFWFTPADPTTLGFIRLCTGILVLYVHLAYTFHLLDYVGPDAWLDSRAAHYLRSEIRISAPSSDWSDEPVEIVRGHTIWSVYFHLTDPLWIYVTHGCILVAMALFAAGLWSRVTSVLACAGSLCYLNRAPTTLFGMDTMMNLLLIYLTIGPSGAVLSVDRWWERRRARALGVALPPPAPSVSANVALRLMQVNFCIIYMDAGLAKLQGSAWWNGTALWGTLANDTFAPLTVAWYYRSLAFLARHRWLWELAMSAGSLFTVALEIGLPFFIWLPRWRPKMVCAAVLLHTGIGLTMGLTPFGLMMLCLLFSFVPPEGVHYLLDRIRRLAGPLAASRDRVEPASPGKGRDLTPAQQ